MKKRLITKILLLITAISCSLAFTACVGEISFEDYRKQNEIYSDVYYYANGGTFDSSSSVSVKWLGLSYHDGVTTSPVIDITEETEKVSVKRTDYIIEGWYYAELDESGEVVWADEEQTIPKATDEKAEFPFFVEKNTTVYLVAKWKEDVKVEIYLVSDADVICNEKDENGKDVKDEDGNTIEKSYKNGELIATKNFGRFTTLSITNDPIASTNSTYLQIYANKECTEKIDKIEKPEVGNVKVYAKYKEGKWTLVSTAADVRNMFNDLNTENNKYYLLNDIDCLTNNGKLSCPSPSTFRGIIQGNGYTVSNIQFTKSNAIGQGETACALGKLCATASVSNLTLKDIDVSYSVKASGTKVFALFGSVEENVPKTAFSDFKVENITLTIKVSKDNKIDNIGENGEYSQSNILFGGYSTDEEFLEKFTEISVTNAQLIINN